MTKTKKCSRSFRQGIAGLVTDSVGFGILGYFAFAEFAGSGRFVENLQSPSSLQAGVALAGLYGVYRTGKELLEISIGRFID